MVIQDKSAGKWHQANFIKQLPDTQFQFSAQICWKMASGKFHRACRCPVLVFLNQFYFLFSVIGYKNPET
ncbi:unnamed protein product [Arabidopsis halleri]